MSRALFLLKLRQDYGDDETYTYSYQVASGMYNSSKFVVDALIAAGREAAVQIVIDGNAIDAAVTQYSPTHVFIEGLWVTPAKLAELQPLHPGVTFVVRIHSEIPFLAQEDVAMEWISAYLAQGVLVAPNSPDVVEQLRLVAELTAQDPAGVIYLPNTYPREFEPLSAFTYIAPGELHVGCFGAIRLLKNQLLQAFVALRLAQRLGRTLHFHINSRQELAGQGPARNITALFDALGAEAVLVEHDWEDRPTFLQSLANVDVVFQMSFSETFNIVAADATAAGTAVLGSSEIEWLYPIFGAATDIKVSVEAAVLLMANRSLAVQGSRQGLTALVEEAERRWQALLPL